MSGHRCCVWVGLFGIAALQGCRPTKVDPQPSYADLVVIYTAELEALDRLEAKRKELIQDYAALSASQAPADAVATLEGLLDSAKSLKDDAATNASTDPNAQLDELVDRHEEARGVAQQLLDNVRTGQSSATAPEPEEVAAVAERKAAFEAALEKLDAEIAKQTERVERARQARDAAEARSR